MKAMALKQDDILTALRDVYDPEIPVNIVDLGLIYRVSITPDPDAPGMIPKHRVEVDMSMTSPGCPMHAMILDNVRNRLACIQEVGETEVNLVWEPTWGPERMSQPARKRLGIG
jgi:metal-sulfur cluster biosynthetic enzyme